MDNIWIRYFVNMNFCMNFWYSHHRIGPTYYDIVVTKIITYCVNIIESNNADYGVLWWSSDVISKYHDKIDWRLPCQCGYPGTMEYFVSLHHHHRQHANIKKIRLKGKFQQEYPLVRKINPRVNKIKKQLLYNQIKVSKTF